MPALTHKPLPRPDTSFKIVSEVVVSSDPKEVWVGSPSLVVMPSGRYFASFDYFGPYFEQYPLASYNESGIYYSDDKGETWSVSEDLSYNCFWGSLHLIEGELYKVGVSARFQNLNKITIKKLNDDGLTWSEEVEIFDGQRFHFGPCSGAVKNGYFYRGFEVDSRNGESWPGYFQTGVIRGHIASGLMNPDSWEISEVITAENGGGSSPTRPLESNVIINAEGGLELLSRADNRATAPSPLVDKAYRHSITESPLSITGEGYLDLPGGNVKFETKIEPVTKFMVAITNYNNPEINDGDERLGLQLVYSRDKGASWQQAALLFDKELNGYANAAAAVDRVGYQYISFDFDGKDLIYLSRTSYAGKDGNAPDSYHNSNRITFHRIENYIRLFNNL